MAIPKKGGIFYSVGSPESMKTLRGGGESCVKALVHHTWMATEFLVDYGMLNIVGDHL